MNATIQRPKPKRRRQTSASVQKKTQTTKAEENQSVISKFKIDRSNYLFIFAIGSILFAFILTSSIFYYFELIPLSEFIDTINESIAEFLLAILSVVLGGAGLVALTEKIGSLEKGFRLSTSQNLQNAISLNNRQTAGYERDVLDLARERTDALLDCFIRATVSLNEAAKVYQRIEENIPLRKTLAGIEDQEEFTIHLLRQTSMEINDLKEEVLETAHSLNGLIQFEEVTVSNIVHHMAKVDEKKKGPSYLYPMRVYQCLGQLAFMFDILTVDIPEWRTEMSEGSKVLPPRLEATRAFLHRCLHYQRSIRATPNDLIDNIGIGTPLFETMKKYLEYLFSSTLESPEYKSRVQVIERLSKDFVEAEDYLKIRLEPYFKPPVEVSTRSI